ncbi:MAG: DNA polymerase III subunit delta [Prevotellaceae bacterium]|jgi:DNA polymerase-3 subunit delta|nr:DNA polymerase III subunit delta [Prevotellaceae bacterium]
MAKIGIKEVIAKYNQILDDLEKKIYYPVYLLMGEEPYYIDKISEYIADNVLDKSEREFNRLILYGIDTDARSIIYAASRPPMMASYQLVIVKEAQNLSSDDIENMESYLTSPLATTILVLCFKNKSIDKRTKAYKAIEKKGVILETAKLYDNEIVTWTTNYLRKKGAAISPSAAAILADHIGADLSRIVNELDKLFILLPENNKTITDEHIEKNIGISKEYNVFALGTAVLSKNTLVANRIINYYAKNPNNNPMILIISSLFSQFLRVLKYHVIKRNNWGIQNKDIAAQLGVIPFFLKDYEAAATKYPILKVVQIIELLREYDMKSKGWNSPGTPDSELLKELVFKIMH